MSAKLIADLAASLAYAQLLLGQKRPSFSSDEMTWFVQAEALKQQADAWLDSEARNPSMGRQW
jgi:hypothetical protein